MVKGSKKVTPQYRAAHIRKLERFLDEIAPKFVHKLTAAEMERDHAKSELERLQSRLRALLTEDQVEAANICGVAPEFYAIEFIELWKEKMFANCPVGIVSLEALRYPYKQA